MYSNAKYLNSKVSFIILIHTSDTPYITDYNLQDLIESYEDTYIDFLNYRINWNPISLDDIVNECILQLNANILSDMYQNCKIVSSAEEYADKCIVDPFNKGTKDYYISKYTYITNSLELLKNMLMDYHNNFILHNENIINESNKDSFDNFKDDINNIDRKQAFSQLQYITYFNIHEDGIFKTSPINSNLSVHSLIDTEDKTEMRINAALLFKELTNQLQTIIATYIIYLYCLCSNSIIRELVVTDTSEYFQMLRDILNKDYNPQKINFNIISCIRT